MAAETILVMRVRSDKEGYLCLPATRMEPNVEVTVEVKVWRKDAEVSVYEKMVHTPPPQHGVYGPLVAQAQGQWTSGGTDGGSGFPLHVPADLLKDSGL